MMPDSAICKEWIFAADLASVDAVCADISSCLAENKLESHIFALQILAHEALNNAVLHGCNLNPSLKVVCELHVTHTSIRLEVTDEGPGFDWKTYLDKGQPDFAQESGRGLSLYAMFADTVKFNPGGNHILLIRRLGKEKMK